MLGAYFDDLAAGLTAKLDSEPLGYVARKRFALEIARLGSRLFSGQGRVAWCGVLAPFDLLSAMGVTSCYAEFVGALLASTGQVESFLERAEEKGFSTDSCSYHRAVLGANEAGLIPEPDFLIATAAPCTGGLAVIEILARHFDKDLFVIHVPHNETSEAVGYLTEQLRAMADFVSAHTGEPLDPDRVRTAVESSNQTRAVLLEVYELARSVPSPARRRDFVNFGIVMSLILGEAAGLEVAEAYRDELGRKVGAGLSGIPDERRRLMWLQNRIQFRHPLDDILAEGHGAAVVVDELNDVTWEPIDPEDPFPGMARRMLSVAFVGPVERRLARIKRQIEAYRIDGVLNPCHWGCRQGAGARGMISAGLKAIGVPVLNLEVDCVDPRNFAEGQLRTRLEAFLEMLDNGRRA